ncbi:hypothetical protein [Psychromonas hadalis]|uniref:hypothetical protein n=1 Tax=Psychromonas hadalis TaxID=211669 RepID=UPI0003F595EE|nr:hypothetical protein [Psychromonas hadalis]
MFLFSRGYFIVFLLAIAPQTLLANDILTATPVTYLLASQLMLGTPITTTYLPPKRYGIERLSHWFFRKGKNSAAQAGEKATVAITLNALWPQDPLFIFTRQGNIKLIEIDASQAISPSGKGIATVQSTSGKASLYAWLNPNNLGMMVSIVSDDLQRVWLEHVKVIEKNQQDFMVNIRLLINQQ